MDDRSFLLWFHHWVVRISFARMPVFLLATQPEVISLVRGAAKVNSTVKMRASPEEWDSLWQSIITFVTRAFSSVNWILQIGVTFLLLCLGPFKDCLQALEEGHTANGMYLVKPENANRLMQVWCDQRHDPGGWTVIQRRVDGSVNFFRNWETYKVRESHTKLPP